MRMQVILDSLFARPGSAPIWGGKKREFRVWTNNNAVTQCHVDGSQRSLPVMSLNLGASPLTIPAFGKLYVF